MTVETEPSTFVDVDSVPSVGTTQGGRYWFDVLFSGKRVRLLLEEKMALFLSLSILSRKGKGDREERYSHNFVFEAAGVGVDPRDDRPGCILTVTMKNGNDLVFSLDEQQVGFLSDIAGKIQSSRRKG